jgi:acyl transferase domain-containing protein
MDPQQRVFLELCWECLERGGHAPGTVGGPVGVFAGAYNASYYQNNVLANPGLVERIGPFQAMLANEKDYIATRVANRLDLTGPAVSVQTGCSTSLGAICAAVDSLRLGRCDMALAGGVSITSPVRSGHLYQEGAMLSPDGHTRSFDADARGTVFSDGAAVLLLKRLEDAQVDGDPILAVIRGTGINNDGGDKASFTAPSSAGQAAVIKMALADADVDPRSISYVETHGTATPVGDPIEIEGLTRAFHGATDDIGYCLIGSVKSNIGHLVAAAGAAGVVKTALALSARRLPPTVHFATPNPTIDFANTPFRVVDRLCAWDTPPGVPRRAGVSSFGVGGTNAHVVMEEAPRHEPSEPGLAPHLLALSARDSDALAAATLRLAEHLERHPDACLADVAWTLARGRKAFPHRLAVAAEDTGAAVARLRSPAVMEMAAGSRPAREADVVFMFPGQGALQSGTGRGLYEREPAFRAAFDECMEHLRPLLPDLGERIFGGGIEALRPTGFMQPATFAIEYALARAWLALGLRPAAMVGHSVGEFVAATLAGVFELPDALRLVARRGALMQAQPGGGMLAVRLGLDTLLERLPGDLSLAAENAPGACVVAGPHGALAAFQATLEADGVACRPLCTSHAFHSTMMDPVVEPFRADVEATPRGAPSIPLVSTATGQWLDAATAGSADYWAAHLRAPVRFAQAIARLVNDSPRVMLEVGPRAGLCQFVRQHPEVQRRPQLATVMSLADAGDERAEAASLLEAAGRLWSLGADIDLAGFDHRRRRRRVCLPTYPFQRRRYWVDPPSTDDAVPQPAITTPSLAQEPLPMPGPVGGGAVVEDGESVAAQHRATLVEELRALFADIAGLDLSGADPEANFMELGLDSLMLTQVVRQVQKAFMVQITFRELMGSCASLGRLAARVHAQLPAAFSRSTS